MINIVIFFSPVWEILIEIIIIVCLLAVSAFMSGAEVAFFSMSPQNIKSLKESKFKNSKLVLNLLNSPERLLATILITNTFVNIGIAIISSYIATTYLVFPNETIKFFVTVISVTLIILIFGEVLPKVYATYFGMRLANFAVFPLFVMGKILKPLSSLLLLSSNVVNKKITRKKMNISIDDLSHALDLTSNQLQEEKDILKGIVRFGNIDVKEIMTPRIDVDAIDLNLNFKEMLEKVIEAGYSRILVYNQTLDHVQGILYLKDLLPFLEKSENFSWNHLIRKSYFVPESKKINDLMIEFQQNKIHMAVVIDEYGGTSGIVTFEDIIEEIVGEINDEFDVEENFYTKIDEQNYLFEGKTLLNDFYRIVQAPDDLFDNLKGDADTLAGLILEIKGEIPKRNDKIKLKNYIFKIESADNRRIKQIRVTLITDN